MDKQFGTAMAIYSPIIDKYIEVECDGVIFNFDDTDTITDYKLACFDPGEQDDIFEALGFADNYNGGYATRR